MLVLIDESGCPGFKFTRGSDPVFGIGMVMLTSGQNAAATERAISELRLELRHKTEFKFSKSSAHVRDRFFQSVANCPFTVRAMLVRKEVLHSAHLRNDTSSFYNFFVKSLMAHDDGSLNAARVRIDGSGSRDFQRALNSYLRRMLGNKLKEVKMSNSESDPLMQPADMCIGAITRAERDRADPDRRKRMLKPRIANVWHFG